MSRLRLNDRGQITTALVIVGTVLVVALGVGVAKLGQATDQKSQVQMAADAAVLAGAQQIRNAAPELIRRSIVDGGGPVDWDTGVRAASDFAIRAGAHVTDYHYYPESDTVEVSVESSTISVSGSPAQAKAEAQLGRKLGNCIVPTQLIPPPTTAPPTTAPPTTAPPTTAPPPIPDTVSCGKVKINVLLDGASGRINIPNESDIRDRIHEELTPALKF